MDLDAIEAHPRKLRNAIYRFLSRNENMPVLKRTEEESLNEVVQALRDEYEEDLDDAVAHGEDRGEERERSLLYPKFAKAAKMKAEECKDMAGYKRLLSVPSFTLGLVMASRLKRHFQRAPWFKVITLGSMLENHGAVSTSHKVMGYC